MAESNSDIQPLFPDIPREVPVIGEDGDFNEMWSLGFSTLFQALQTNFSSEGISLPPLSQTHLDQIKALYTVLIGMPIPPGYSDISGRVVFDITNRIPKQFIILFDSSNPPKVISADWYIINVMLNYAGDPNGNLAGMVNYLCYDITNKVMYICTTSGNTLTAVWTAI